MKLNKQSIKNISYYIAAILGILFIGGAYFLAAEWLISGVFGTTFTLFQTVKATVLLWLTVISVKFFNGVKLEK